MSLKTIRDFDVTGKRVLVRVDYNVPIKNREVRDASRIEASLPTLRHLLERGGRLILMSHLGRPNGRYDESMSLRPVAECLADLIGRPVNMAPDCVGDEVERLRADPMLPEAARPVE